MIRLALRVAEADAELVLAELLELAPSGVEERRLEDGAIEYAVYGAAGELPSVLSGSRTADEPSESARPGKRASPVRTRPTW